MKVVEALLHNRALWSEPAEPRPRLVVCLTPHALDNFLAGLLPLLGEGPNKILRVAGHCKDPRLEDYTMFKVQRSKQTGMGGIYQRQRERREAFRKVSAAQRSTPACSTL
jgi:hypothetical protein